MGVHIKPLHQVSICATNDPLPFSAVVRVIKKATLYFIASCNIVCSLSTVQVATNFEKKGDDIQEAFQNLLANVLDKLSASRDKEELSIIS